MTPGSLQLPVRSPPGRRLLALACTLALAGSAAGCASISYGSGTSHDEVLQIERREVPGQTVQARAWQNGSRLSLKSIQRCDLVEEKEIRRTTVRKAEEDLHEEIAVMGVASAPIVTGAILLADAGEVYESDRNARLYNSAGPEGAIAGGVVLVVLGGIMMTVPTVELIRATGEKEEVNTVRERGAMLQEGIPCRSVRPASGMEVVGRIEATGGMRQYSLGRTDYRGQLNVDLAQVLPVQIFEVEPQPATMEIVVGKTSVGMVDLAPVAEAQQEQRRQEDENQWRQSGSDRCQAEASPPACQGVHYYLQRFPKGIHAEEAKLLLELAQRPPASTIAVPPNGAEGPPPDAAARERACARQCNARCLRDSGCTTRCIQECLSR